MKHRLLLILPLLVLGCSEPVEKPEPSDSTPIAEPAKAVGPDELVNRNGVKYLKLSDAPFTGPFEAYYENGQLSAKGTHKDGKQDGTWAWYHDNGQLLEKSNSRNGKRDGPFESYDENGQLLEKGIFKDGTLVE